MALPFFIMLTPAPMGFGNIPWPSAAVLLGGSLKEKGVAVIFILILMFIVWCYIKSSDKFNEMEWKKRVESDERIKKATENEQLAIIKQRTKDL